MTTKYQVTIKSQSGTFKQEHIVSRKAAQTIADYINNHGYSTFNDVESVEIQPYVWKHWQ